MERYLNRGGNSGVSAYEIGDDSVTVRFLDGWCYLYTFSSAGERNIEKMKSLAVAGKGLNSYINRNVRKLYERKFR